MIVRVMGDSQYELPDQMVEELNRIDNEIVRMIEEGNEEGFRRELKRLISTVKEKGTPVRDIVSSDIIVPPEDLSFEEAKKIFRGDGIIPG